jgi:hypothetical protein
MPVAMMSRDVQVTEFNVTAYRVGMQSNVGLSAVSL